MANQDRSPSDPVASTPIPGPVDAGGTGVEDTASLAQYEASLLERALLDDPYSFDFFYALRQVECLHPETARLGKAVRPAEESIRLGQDCSMAFAPAALSSSARDSKTGLLRLGVAFLGVFGPNGPLPLHLTEYALERAKRYKDKTFLGFADVFHHRFLCLFYRGWANAQPTVSFDRPSEDRFGEYVASLCGLGMPSLRNRDAMPDLAKLHFAGRLLGVAKNAEGLEAIIQGYFRVACWISEFVGEWLKISAKDRCLLGATPTTGALGETAVVGAYSFECQHKFRIHIGPIGLRNYEELLPRGASLPSLIAIVRNYVGDEYAWDLQLILKKEEVPALTLGESARLGWTTWLGQRRGDKDADDLILDPMQ